MIDLRAERLNRGKSQREMAEIIGVTRRVIQRAEDGSRPDLPNALLIAEYFGVRVTDIWPLEGSETGAAA